MSKEKINIPQADMLMGSMRSMGYSFESAIADVVDNSISAGAKKIRVLFPTSPLDDLTVGILDDGKGMDNDTLFEAMRYGSSSSEDVRNEDDLGRFGLGLKSASLSQCRVLTVISLYEGKYSSYTWDFNHVKQTKKWTLLSFTKAEREKLPYFKLLKEQGVGTLILWSDFDILSKSNDGQVYAALDSLKSSVAKHMSLIFHRYMSRTRKKVAMYVNNQKLKPLDPFLENHQKTTTKKERTIAVVDSNGIEQQIHVRPFILPYLSDMTDKDKKLMGGVEEMRTKQGFYVYRNERLIIWGNWFGMKQRSELTKNARIRVDIPNALDDIWSIDIKKQVAQIPKRIQNQLKSMVREAMEISVTKQTHRGRRQKVDESIDYIWDRIQGRDKSFFYKINRESELLKFVLGKLSDADVAYVNMLLNEIERSIPMQQIYLDKSNDCIIEEEDNHREDDIFQMAVTMIDSGTAISPLTTNQLIDDLMKSEPFCLFQGLKGRLTKYFDHEDD